MCYQASGFGDIRLRSPLDIQVVIGGRQLFMLVWFRGKGLRVKTEIERKSTANTMIVYPDQRWGSLSCLYNYRMLPWTATTRLSPKNFVPSFRRYISSVCCI